MSLISTIYNLKPEYQVLEDEQFVYATLTFNNTKYKGFAATHSEDCIFFSEKVGKKIALSRARLSILTAELEKIKQEYLIKERMIREVQGYKHLNPEEEENLIIKKFYQNLLHCKCRLDSLNKIIKKERRGLRLYLEAQDKALDIVRRMRKDNNN